MPRFLMPLKPVRPRVRLALGLLCFALVLASWAGVTMGGIVKPLYLADPLRTLEAGYTLFVQYDFLFDIGMTIWRVVGGFVFAALVAIPTGILMGAFKPVEAFFEPFVSFGRYLPASAFIPLLILWAGIGEAEKLSVIFIGAVFQLTLMATVIVGGIRTDLIEASYTLGSRGFRVIRRVMLPAAAPQLAEALRLVLGWAWTYVIVAELVGAETGIGHMIMDSQRILDTGQMIFGIFVIGVIGLLSDLTFKQVNYRLFPWYFG
jgi:NitT/TauT family transport system permease protein